MYARWGWKIQQRCILAKASFCGAPASQDGSTAYVPDGKQVYSSDARPRAKLAGRSATHRHQKGRCGLTCAFLNGS